MLATGLALFAVTRFHFPLGYQTTARIVVILAGADIAVSLVSGTFGGVVAALQRFDALNGVEILVAGLRAVTIVTALAMCRSLITLACIHVTFSALRGLASLIVSKKLYPELRFAFSNADPAHARLISFSFVDGISVRPDLGDILRILALMMLFYAGIFQSRAYGLTANPSDFLNHASPAEVLVGVGKAVFIHERGQSCSVPKKVCSPQAIVSSL